LYISIKTTKRAVVIFTGQQHQDYSTTAALTNYVNCR